MESITETLKHKCENTYKVEPDVYSFLPGLAVSEREYDFVGKQFDFASR